jgi:hypothetical protein
MLVLFCACMALVVALVTCRRNNDATAAKLKAVMVSEKSAVRQLRLASHNLRAVGMTLQGHVEYLDAGGELDIVGIANLATGVFDIADYMHEWAQHAQSQHTLDDETVELGGALDQAISMVTRSILPARRSWRVDPDIIPVRLRCDRRALDHVLTRALGVAVRGGRHDDGVDIRIERVELDGVGGALALVIEQRVDASRHGNPTFVGSAPDLRLTLARALMEAHGGRLEIEQTDGLGIRIAFPAERVVSRGNATAERPMARVTERDDRLQRT